mgnify:CR=1 FL=1
MATTSGTAKKTTAASVAKTAASATAAAKKPVAAKAAAPKKAVARKPAAPKKPAAKRAAKSIVTPEQRYCMVAEAAYFHAERHGFLGDPVQDWIAAEAEIAALLSGK